MSRSIRPQEKRRGKGLKDIALERSCDEDMTHADPGNMAAHTRALTNALGKRTTNKLTLIERFDLLFCSFLDLRSFYFQ